jgi:5,10-methylenetetrahydrofolate reductase
MTMTAKEVGMSDAFEQWAADKSFMLRVSAGDGYVNVREMALEAWQAALQHSREPVVPPQWRVVMRGMIEYAECNDPGNPYLPQAQALLSAGKGGE